MLPCLESEFSKMYVNKTSIATEKKNLNAVATMNSAS
jgi:hypothetical protein